MTIDFGTIARTRRNELGLTQKQVADRACVCRDTVISFEGNKRDIRFDIILNIFNALGLRMTVEEVEA